MRRLLLACGLLSSLVYFSADVIGAWRWEGYSYTGQTISELAAKDAPSYSTVGPIFALYNILIVAFAIGVGESAAGPRLRWTGLSLASIGIIGIVAGLFPIQTRGHQWTVNETMHIILTTMTVLLIVASMVLGMRAGGNAFLIGTWVAVALVVGCGIFAGAMGRNIASEPVTPWIGVVERVSVFTYLLWVAWLGLTHLGDGSHVGEECRHVIGEFSALPGLFPAPGMFPRLWRRGICVARIQQQSRLS